MPVDPDSDLKMPAQPAIPTARDFYIDRLRSVMTVFVLLHHTAIVYGAPGGWFWNELHPSGTAASLLLTLFVSTNQAYFMGFFFLLAGYFTPGSLERKGYARFIGDRFLRLGIPLLAFGLLLGPLTAAIVNRFAEGGSFIATFTWLWQHKRFISGPLWFAQALLIFSLAYCLWRRFFGSSLTNTTRASRPIPRALTWLLSALVVGAAALAIRQFIPVGENVFGLQLAYFAAYIFLFAIGIAAWRYNWLRQLRWSNARVGIIAAILAWPLMPLAIALARALNAPGKSNFAGGFTWPAILYALWEPFVAWGLIAAWLLAFHRWMNRPSKLWSWLNRRAYAVYIIHPVVLVSISLAFHSWIAPALVKFAVTGSLTCIATWLLCDPLVRLPGIRNIV
ncbi:MAG TPA: acyltransferase family protein [Terracidiphilus sp.]|jgi:peptidoglycan/LPS O-acetylase OafA/YrhL|nr:acyltransferase family protein [Terracidiphilus sp.]